MKKYERHICFVSKHNMPNVTPVLDDKLRPDSIVLCTVDGMMKNALRLRDFFNSKGIDATIFPVGDAYDYVQLKNAFLEIAANSPLDSTVNLSCGNKLMTIAAQEVFETDFDLYYVIPNKDLIVKVANEREPLYDIQDKIKLEDFFAVYGYKVNKIVRKKTVEKNARDLFNELIPKVDKYGKVLGTLNHLAKKAKKLSTLEIANNIPEASWELLYLFQKHGAIYYFDDNKITFFSEETRDFCNGLWFEDFVYLKLKKYFRENFFQDFAVSIEIENDNGVKNEIDAAILENNTLYLIECKTSKMDEAGTGIVYKIDTIKNYAGLNTKGVIASYRRLLRHDCRRAADLNINVIHGNEINRLTERMPIVKGPASIKEAVS